MKSTEDERDRLPPARPRVFRRFRACRVPMSYTARWRVVARQRL